MAVRSANIVAARGTALYYPSYNSLLLTHMKLLPMPSERLLALAAWTR